MLRSRTSIVFEGWMAIHTLVLFARSSVTTRWCKLYHNPFGSRVGIVNYVRLYNNLNFTGVRVLLSINLPFYKAVGVRSL